MDFDNNIEQFYSTLLSEHTRILGELKNNTEKFAENEKMHTLVSSLMKDILKIKNYKQKLKLKMNE
jgi:hypothetical protein